MNVLSLFDGISCGRVALDRAGIKVDNYYSSEIDKYAITVSQKNYPDIIRLGNVVYVEDVPNIDLLIGGSPCQGFSFAGKQLNFQDPRSSLFFEFVRLLEKTKPKYFLLENVKMKQEYQDILSGYLGVKPIEINSSLVSAQNRKRLYWTNIPNVEQPEDKKILLNDIVLDDVFPIALHNLYGGFKETSVRVFQDKSPTLRTAAGGGHIPSFVKKDLINNEEFIKDNNFDGSVANFFKGVSYNEFKDWDCIRKFHPIECERLQTLPDGYTEGISDTQRYKCIGNGWTVDVIAHILKGIK